MKYVITKDGMIHRFTSFSRRIDFLQKNYKNQEVVCLDHYPSEHEYYEALDYLS